MCFKRLKLIQDTNLIVDTALYNMYFLANQIAYFKILLTRRCFEYTRLQEYKISDLTREKNEFIFAAKDYVSDFN